MPKQGWGRDVGVKPGHSEFPAHQPAACHTKFDARGFGDKGHNLANTHHQNFTNRHLHDPEMKHSVNVEAGHDPRPEHFHKNSGTTSEGHQLVRRGGSVIHGMSKGYKE